MRFRFSLTCTALAALFLPGIVLAQGAGMPIPGTTPMRGAEEAARTNSPSGRTVCILNSDCADGSECTNGRCVTPTPANQQTIEQVEGHITAPVLAVPIPGLAAFQNPTVQGSDGQQYLDIPFLAQYISAVYTYALGIIVTIATVMVVIGGLKWMLARGDSGKVSDAKETLSRAVIGVLLALGSYAILNLLNPELVNLRALRIQLIQRDEVDEALLTTRVETFDTDATSASGGAVGSSSGGGGYQRCTNSPARSSGCPVSLSQAVTCSDPREPRTREFLAAITGTCPHGREGVVCAAQAAARCGLHMGSCLATAQALARATGATIQGRGSNREVNSNLLQPAQAIGRSCRDAGGSDADCRRQAKQAAADAIRAAKPGWPEAWISELQPGDMIRIYNARPGGVGQHSALVISISGNYANVVQGQYGHYVTTGRLCIHPSCGGILTKTYQTQ